MVNKVVGISQRAVSFGVPIGMSKMSDTWDKQTHMVMHDYVST